MKLRKLSVTAAIVLVVGSPCLAQLPFQSSQQGGLISIGSSSLPAGQYVLTNLGTGQALYIQVNSGGQIMAQDPRALQITVQPAATGLSQPLQQPSGWGGILKQGFETFMQNRAPGAAPGQ